VILFSQHIKTGNNVVNNCNMRIIGVLPSSSRISLVINESFVFFWRLRGSSDRCLMFLTLRNVIWCKGFLLYNTAEPASRWAAAFLRIPSYQVVTDHRAEMRQRLTNDVECRKFHNKSFDVLMIRRGSNKRHTTVFW